MAGSLFYFFTVFFAVLVVYTHLGVFKYLLQSKGRERQQIKYVLVGTFIGFFGGSTNFPLWFGVPIPPFLHFLVSIYVFLVAIAIVKHRLMDIRVAVALATIFLTVYAIALGVPFYLYSTGSHFLALIVSAFLASAAPFVYAKLRHGAEEGLLRDQFAYQDALIRSAQELTRIKDVDGVAGFVVESLLNTTKVSSAIYLKANEHFYRKAFVAGASEYPKDVSDPINVFQRPEWEGYLLLPLSRDQEILGYLLLGNKADNNLWTEKDLFVVRALLDQAALAIENALYVEHLAMTREQLIESEKMATIGFLVGGLAHQLKNRFTSFVFFSDFVFRKVSAHRGAVLPAEECDEALSYLEKITAGVHSSKEIVNGVLNYASDRQIKSDINIKDLIASTVDLIEYKIPAGSVVFENFIPDDAPRVNGSVAQIQEVFFNIIDNAYHSMVERKDLGQVPGYTPRIEFTASTENGVLQIKIMDNGMGIKPENMRKLFTPFFTTKAMSKEGTGLGLYVIRKIIEDNHGGKVEMHSVYGQGTDVILSFLFTNKD